MQFINVDCAGLFYAHIFPAVQECDATAAAMKIYCPAKIVLSIFKFSNHCIFKFSLSFHTPFQANMFVSAMDTITLKEMIAHIDSGKMFRMGWRTCDLNKNTGGEWIEVSVACKHRDSLENVQREKGGASGIRRNPNHFKNSTRNIRTVPEGRIYKVHIRLIRMFNGKTVL